MFGSNPVCFSPLATRPIGTWWQAERVGVAVQAASAGVLGVSNTHVDEQDGVIPSDRIARVIQNHDSMNDT